MDAYTAAYKAFIRCKSRSADKNQACAPYLAKLYLSSAGVQGNDLEVAVEYVHRLLDNWFEQKASDDSFYPQPKDPEAGEVRSIVKQVAYVESDDVG